MMPIMMAAMMDPVKSAKTVKMQATSMKAVGAMTNAAVSEQEICSEMAIRMATTATANSLMVVVPAGKVGFLE